MGCWRVGIVTVQFWLCLKQQITRIRTPFFMNREFILGCYFKAVNGSCADTQHVVLGMYFFRSTSQ